MTPSPLILIVNQHGDNRGDEAAMQGMISALRARVPGARFTVLHQFAAPASRIDLQGVDYLPLRMPITEALRLAIWAALRVVGIRAKRVAGPIGRDMLTGYEDAVIVVSAPGGPYFGDLYANHEIVHWFFVWLARLHGKPLALYQPSAGPFENRLLGPVRKRGYRMFDHLAVREAISAANIERFTGRRPAIGSDSALHRRIDAPARQPGLVTGTFRDPGPELRETHDQAVVDVMVRLGESGRHVRLLPQLHGTRHADKPYLETLASAARARGADVTVEPDTLSADEQRELVGASDLVLAGRYHPLVFAVSARVPALVIPYEHKARGVAAAAGIGDYIVDLDQVGGGALVDRLDVLLGALDDVRGTLQANAGTLEAAAEATADAVAALAPTGVKAS